MQATTNQGESSTPCSSQVKRLGELGLVALLGAVAVMPARADEAAPKLDFNGSLRTSAWTYSRDLNRQGPVATEDIWLRVGGDFSSAGKVVLDGWLQAKQVHAASGTDIGRVREFYWRKNIGEVDVRVGRQLYQWGRADGINPTDNLSPRDFTVLAVEDSDQRIGTTSVSANYALKDYSLQWVWMPRFRTSTIPLTPLANVNYLYLDPQQRQQWAFKLDRSGGEVDWSLSYFDGYDPMPDLSIAGLGPKGLNIALSNQHVRVLGADASSTVGSYVLRTEIAWSQTANSGGADFFKKKSQLWWVAGGDHNLSEHLNLNMQVFAQWVPDYKNPDQLTDPLVRVVAQRQAAINNQTGNTQYGMTFRLATSWANETWQAEVSGLYSFSTNAYLLRGKLTHAINDRWRFRVGVDRISGRETTVFGQLKDNSTGFAELRYVF